MELRDPLPLALAPGRGAARRAHGVGGVLLSATKLGALWLFVYTFLFNFSVVRGNSMAPNILDGDRIVVDHVTYVLGEVHRGDVIVLRYPLDPSVDYIKRVVGLPGDEIEIRGGLVWVNGRRLEEDYGVLRDPRGALRVRVSAGHFFVLGDNRPRSSDSREFGLVPAHHVRGRVELRVWPLTRFGRV